MFSHSIRLGRLLGIEIEVDYTWFIILVLFTITFAQLPAVRDALFGLSPAYHWLFGLITALLLFTSVVLHELSHSVLAKINGLGISGITLFLFGGVSKLTREPRSPLAEFQIAVAGPVVSLALAACFWVLAHFFALAGLGPVLPTMFGLLAWLNLSLAIFNLLPGFPLDGGRVLRAVVWYASGNFARATRVASLSGQALGFILIFVGIMALLGREPFTGIWMAFIGWFLIQAAQSSYQQVVLKRLLSGVPVSSLMSSEVKSIAAETTLEAAVHDYFLTFNYTAFPVLRNGEVAGLISLSAVRKTPREKWALTSVGDITPPLPSDQVIGPAEDAWEAMTRMTAEGGGRLLIMQDKALLGILSRSDIMRLLRTKMELGA